MIHVQTLSQRMPGFNRTFPRLPEAELQSASGGFKLYFHHVHVCLCCRLIDEFNTGLQFINIQKDQVGALLMS